MHACDTMGRGSQLNTHLIAFWLDSKLDSKCSFLKASPHDGYEMQTLPIC